MYAIPAAVHREFLHTKCKGLLITVKPSKRILIDLSSDRQTSHKSAFNHFFLILETMAFLKQRRGSDGKIFKSFVPFSLFICILLFH